MQESKRDYMKALNEHFLYNHKLAKALQQFLSSSGELMLFFLPYKRYEYKFDFFLFSV